MRHLFFLLFCLTAASHASAASRVVVITIDNVIHPITTEIVNHAVAEAEAEGAAAILIRLNTPGGLLESTREITERLVSSEVPVITYVTPSGGRAASAGFFILQAGDLAAMAPGTRTGVASPVLMGQEMDPVMRRKVENDAAAAIRSIVDKRGRNTELAEKAVLEAKAFTETEALENNLIELIAQSEAELFSEIDGREITRFDGEKMTLALTDPEVTEYDKSLREEFMSAIADPNLALVLLVLGALGVYVEFSSPGLIVPGVGGAILALLGLSALAVLPINWLGVALLILAVVLFILEASIASHGILATGGAVAMVLGSVLLVEGPPALQIRWSTAIAVSLPFALITVFLVSLIVQARRNKVVTGSDGLVGSEGSAHTELSPTGSVFVHGEFWDAVATKPVAAGARVKVRTVDGLKLTVEPVDQEEDSSV